MERTEMRCWNVEGLVWKEGEARSKGDLRKLVAAMPFDADAQAVMQEANGVLLHNWSRQPHKVEVRKVELTSLEVIVCLP